jgi:hypothetical protein
MYEPPLMSIPDVTSPMVKQMLVTSTKTAQPRAMRELVFHPPNLFLDAVVPGDLGKRGCGVLARGSGVYAVALLRSGLKRWALGRLEPPVRGSGVNCTLSVDPRC